MESGALTVHILEVQMTDKMGNRKQVFCALLEVHTEHLVLI